MYKYWLVFITTIKEYSVYRLNFIIWRLRVFLNFLITFFLWNAVLENQQRFGHYSKTEFISYIFFANLIANFVLGTRTVDVAGEITNGTIMNYLLRPISFFRYYLTRDLADKLLNLFFAVIEISFIIILFKPQLSLPLTPNHYLPTTLFLIIGTLISFYLSLIISFIGFWSHETWGPRFIFMILVLFLSGSYFPLDLLPQKIFFIFLLTPFPYLYYLPTRIFLGKPGLISSFTLSMAFFWVFAISFFAHYLWQKGNRSYHFFGR